MTITSIRKGYLDEYIACQTLLHAWDPIPDDGLLLTDYNGVPGAKRKLFRCERCTTKRLDIWSRVTGALVARTYDYPQDYSLQIGELAEGQTRRMLARLEYLKRGIE
jgi:hypothetical protein